MGRGPVEDELPVAAGPFRVERGAVRSAGGLLAAYAGHELGADYRPRQPGLLADTSCNRDTKGRHPRSGSQSGSWCRQSTPRGRSRRRSRAVIADPSGCASPAGASRRRGSPRSRPARGHTSCSDAGSS